jgi:hypothetical protein
MTTEADDDVLMRFLVGELPEAERERIEARFMSDPAFYEELCALEHDMLLSYARHELAEPWRTALEARLAESPSLRRELESVTTLRAALGTVPVASTRSRSLRRWLGVFAVAAVLVVAVAILRTRLPGVPVGSVPRLSVSGTVPTFVLEPGTKSATQPSLNSFQLRAGVDRIELRLTVPVAVEAADAFIRPVGGSPLAITGPMTVTNTGTTSVISWTIPTRDLSTGDYILTVVDKRAPSGTPIASRFFSIVP